MLLADLLDAPHLGLRLLHGPEEALQTPVRWVYTTDLPDPGRYVSGGELVVTGLVWRTGPDSSATFVAAVARAGACALAAGDALFHGIPDDVVQACREHDLVLFGVPEDVSFGDLTEYVLGQAGAERGARLEASLARQRQLLAGMAEGRALDDLCADVSRETGLACRVLTATGRHVVTGPVPLSEPDLDRVTRCFLAADQLPASCNGGAATYSVFPVGPALGQRVTSWMVVVEGDWAGWEPHVSDAVGELAAIAALERVRRDEGLRVGRHIAEDAVALVAAGSGGQPEALARLRQAGLDPSAPLAVAVAGFADSPGLGEASWSVLYDAATHLGEPVVTRWAEGSAVAVLPAAQPGFADILRRALLRLGPGLARERLTVGVSEASEPAVLSGAWEEARYAQRLAELRQGSRGTVSVVTGEEVTSYVLLLATVPDEIRRTFATRVLGPVLAYDDKHDAGLRETLETFLDCSCSWSRTAERLHLHVNTVRYRIARVEDLTGRDLSDLEDRVDAFLALRSL
ncbi:MAG TPA: helix-turn-helix domain-containing protein [Nocardioidaceae bacterium]|nr:helix-turn-helix domain-containing protein [Nocardioidaceae bacterium]